MTHECKYCKNTKDLALDFLDSFDGETSFLCEDCIDDLEDGISKYLDKNMTQAKATDLARNDMSKKNNTLRLKITKEKRESYMEELNKSAKLAKEKDYPAPHNISIKVQKTEHLLHHECKKCKSIGTLDIHDGDLVRIDSKVQETVQYDDELRLEVPFGISFETFDYTLCKSCLNKIKNK